MNKAFRHGQILRLIRERAIHTQETLAQELTNMGIPSTQVTLSRDMRELGLVKTPQGYKQVTLAPSGPGFAAVANEFLQDVRMAQNLVILRTSPGNANTLAIALDKESWPEIAGTLAGDDTIFVAAADNHTALRLRDRFVAFVRGPVGGNASEGPDSPA